MILKAFITNLKSDSVTMRRTAAQCLTLICQYSHRPGTFMVWTLRVLLGMIMCNHFKSFRFLIEISVQLVQ